MKIPLSEHFHSIQGEGTWTGTPMHFIRLPGCSVGKLIDPNKVNPEDSIVPTLPTGRPAWLCHRWDGTPFWCDTDFNKYEEIELDNLLFETWEDHICITGGEPLIHTEVVKALIDAARDWNKSIHIETSGTLEFDRGHLDRLDYVWVTVSPKMHYLPSMLQRADELKLLVGPYQLSPWPPEILSHKNVFVSPINDVSELNQDSLALAMEVLRTQPSWRLSVQLHKYLRVR